MIERGTQLCQQLAAGTGQVLFFLLLSVDSTILVAGSLARLLDPRSGHESNGKRAAADLTVKIVRHQKGSLQIAQSPLQVRMKRGRQRIAMPPGQRNRRPDLLELRVIERDRNEALARESQTLGKDRIVQLGRLP